MKEYTYDELVAAGYKIKNAKISKVDLSMEDHGCLTLYMSLSGHSWGCVYGGYSIGNGYLGAKSFKGSAAGTEYIMRIMDTVGVERFKNLEGKYVRVAIGDWGEPIKIIGNIIEDKWFDTGSFFEEYNYG